MKTGRKITTIALILSMLLALSGCSVASDFLLSDTAQDAPAVSGYSDGVYYDYGSGEQYLAIDEQGEQLVSKRPEATFSLKVDTASYSNVKRFIENGSLPPPDAVRTEELINWFSFDEPLQFDRTSPFGFYTEIGPSPFDEEKSLALVRVGTREVDRSELPASNLVFLIDVSGSMSSYDKLPLLQESLALLVETLDEDDRVSIVTYASGTEVVLRGASGSDNQYIEDAIFSLRAGGSTAGEQGIQTAYELAERYFIEGGNNRVILATDGDFNVGISSTRELSRFISKQRNTGVYLSVLGFGTGNIRDDIMETLAKDGNGNYNYIDSIRTAEKVLVNELASNLFTVADDVKAQIVFNEEAVYSYRLIGYENRMLKAEDFDDDRVDAGEIGAGTDIILLFEFTTHDAQAVEGDHLFDVRIRYKDPGEKASQLVEFPQYQEYADSKNTTDFGFVSAVALFGDFLRNEGAGGRNALRTMTDLAEENLGKDRAGYREDFVDLLYLLRSAR
ncbi:MAG: VWA domain-containing protein [Coriobacteriia bacterium]|nr:VWA domain-containing protein [Coriobacteriia bacterium]